MQFCCTAVSYLTDYVPFPFKDTDTSPKFEILENTLFWVV